MARRLRLMGTTVHMATENPQIALVTEFRTEAGLIVPLAQTGRAREMAMVNRHRILVTETRTEVVINNGSILKLRLVMESQPIAQLIN